MNNKLEHYGHGELNLFELEEAPDMATLKPYKIPDDKKIKDGLILANSEVTGNHHMIKLTEGVTLYEREDGTLIIRNENPTELYCVDETRHSAVEVKPSWYEVIISAEEDHLTNIQRNVAD